MASPGAAETVAQGPCDDGIRAGSSGDGRARPMRRQRQQEEQWWRPRKERRWRLWLREARAAMVVARGSNKRAVAARDASGDRWRLQATCVAGRRRDGIPIQRGRCPPSSRSPSGSTRKWWVIQRGFTLHLTIYAISFTIYAQN